MKGIIIIGSFIALVISAIVVWAAPTTCPGFTQKDIEAVFVAYPDVTCELVEGATSKTGEPCSWVDCGEHGGINFWASKGPKDFKTAGTCSSDGISIASNPNKVTPTTINGRITISEVITIEEEQADACVAILKTFVP